jgi:glycosyltransferase involved in cell wall biosynthesis
MHLIFLLSTEFFNEKSKMNQISPILSIITPTYNRATVLREAIESVQMQSDFTFEHIIIDGGSTDNTYDVVREYPHLIFISEPDEGLYFAINKGLQMARGKYIGLLNSDDYYKPNSLKNALEILMATPTLMAVFGSAEVVFDDIRKPPILIPYIFQNEMLQKASSDSVAINSSLISKEAYNQLGGFNVLYKVASDKEFLFRFGLAGIPYASFDKVLYCYKAHDTSLTFGKLVDSKIQGDLEEMDIAQKFCEQYSESDEIIRICNHWFSRAVADAALLSFSEFKIIKALNLAKSGFHENFRWGEIFIKALLLKLVRFIFSAKTRAKHSKYKKFLLD